MARGSSLAACLACACSVRGASVHDACCPRVTLDRSVAKLQPLGRSRRSAPRRGSIGSISSRVQRQGQQAALGLRQRRASQGRGRLAAAYCARCDGDLSDVADLIDAGDLEGGSAGHGERGGQVASRGRCCVLDKCQRRRPAAVVRTLKRKASTVPYTTPARSQGKQGRNSRAAGVQSAATCHGSEFVRKGGCCACQTGVSVPMEPPSAAPMPKLFTTRDTQGWSSTPMGLKSVSSSDRVNIEELGSRRCRKGARRQRALGATRRRKAA